MLLVLYDYCAILHMLPISAIETYECAKEYRILSMLMLRFL